MPRPLARVGADYVTAVVSPDRTQVAYTVFHHDDLNCISRKGYPDLLEAAFRGTNEAYYDAARPTADIVLPNISEHTVGQLLQMLMLATAVEARLCGTNPYGQPGTEIYKSNMMRILRASPNLPKGEVRDAAKGM